MELPEDIEQQWEVAYLELRHAKLSWSRPGFSDELSDLDDRLTSAHRAMAAVYDRIAAVPALPPALVAATSTAATAHRDQARSARRSPEVSDV